MKRWIACISIAMMLSGTLSVAQANDFNAAIEVSRTENEIMVIIPDNADVYNRVDTTISIPCDAQWKAVVVKQDGKSIPATLQDGMVTFPVKQGGEYVLTLSTDSENSNQDTSTGGAQHPVHDDTQKETSSSDVSNSTDTTDINKFEDIYVGDWYFDAVQYVYENDMMTGTSDTTFSPNQTTTRGMIVTILYRLEGTPDLANENLGYPYADVEADAYYADAVYWARQNNIVAGMSTEQFAPNNAITREQMAAILYRYAQFKGYDVSAKADLSTYTDAADVSAYATDAMAWASQTGLITGTSATTLSPAGQATRAQVATILVRFCENVVK